MHSNFRNEMYCKRITLKRSKIETNGTKTTEFFSFLSAWIDDDLPLFVKLSQRITEITGLSTVQRDISSDAEAYQVRGRICE